MPKWVITMDRYPHLASLDAHAFLKGIDLAFVLDHLNGELSWGGATDIH